VVVTVIDTVPGSTVAGEVTVTAVVATDTTVAGSDPNFTVAPVTNPVPVIVTVVPPVTGPVAGDTDVTVGVTTVYVKSFPVPAVELGPPDVVTTTFARPAVTVAGVTIVIDVADTSVTSPAGTAIPPTDTVAPVMNPVPVTVTGVPPVTGPVAGDNVVTVGTGAVYAKSFTVPDADDVPPDVVTITSTVPTTVVAGDTTVNCVGDTTVAATGARPSKATVAPVTNPVPLTVTVVPPEVGPVAGEIDVTVGTGAVYVKSSAAAPCAPPGVDEPPDVVTVTATVPGSTVAGDTTVIDVGDTTVTLVPGNSPNLTVAPVTNPVPEIVTVVPPDVGPDDGDSPVTVGTGAV
jgi:hypothetical protein